MFDTIAEMLRGSAPDDLAHALGTDRTQTRRAMEIGLPALITGLRDKTLEPGGAQNLASMLDEPSAGVPPDVDAYLAAGDPSQGASMLDVAFGDRGEPALAALSSASGLSTRLLAQVMSVLAPLATGTVAKVSDRSPQGLRSYLSDAVEDLEAKGFGRVVELVSPTDLSSAALRNESGDVFDTDGANIDGSDLDSELEGIDLDASDLDRELEGVDLANADVDSLSTATSSLDADREAVDIVPEVDIDGGGVIVEGAFPDAAEADVEIDLGDGDIDVDLPELSPTTSSFDAEIGTVAPAGVAIAGEAVGSSSANAPTVALDDRPKPSGVVGIDSEADLEGQGMSGLGWLWWALAAILALVLLVLAISRCGGSDDGTVATDADVTAAEPVETVGADPALAQRQATLDGVLVNYPGVMGEVFGEVAVLNGTVADDTERALLDQAVRAAGLQVQNNVVAQAPTASAPEGYSINDLIDAQPELSTLKAVLAQAGLGEALGGAGPFTLFAPTNEAFANISEQVAELQNDPDMLQQVLRYHLLIGNQDAATVSGATSLPTQLDDQTIQVGVVNGAVTLNGSARVIVPDATARNGVIHIVDAVLLPQFASALPEEIGAELGLAPITFALGSAELTDAGQAELDKVVAFLQQNPGNIEIGGHTDSDGDPAYNLTLSQDRADAVKNYLSAQGIPADSMTAVGFGEDTPIAANDTAENKAKNRRIEFRPA